MPRSARRRWFQFGTRGLLAFLVVAAAVAAWIGYHRRASVLEQRIAKQLTSAGGRVRWTGEFYREDAYDPPDRPPGEASSWWRKTLSTTCGLRVRDVNTSLIAERFDDLTPLAGFSKVKSLNLPFGSYTDLWPLAKLEGLETLSLNLAPVADLAPLAGLQRLTSLSLERTQVRDLSPLAGLVNLRRLNLFGAPVEDLSPLAGLTQLRSLMIGDTNVSDLTPLAGLPNLQYLDIQGAPISDEQLRKLQQAAPNCLVKPTEAFTPAREVNAHYGEPAE